MYLAVLKASSIRSESWLRPLQSDWPNFANGGGLLQVGVLRDVAGAGEEK